MFFAVKSMPLSSIVRKRAVIWVFWWSTIGGIRAYLRAGSAVIEGSITVAEVEGTGEGVLSISYLFAVAAIGEGERDLSFRYIFLYLGDERGELLGEL